MGASLIIAYAGSAPAAQKQPRQRDVPGRLPVARSGGVGRNSLGGLQTQAVACAIPQRSLPLSSAESGRRWGQAAYGQGEESSTGASQLRPAVPLCVTLKRLPVPARSPAPAIYSPGTSLLTSSSVLPYEIPVSLSHALSQDTCRSRRRKGTFKSFPHSEQEREGSLAPRWMGDGEAPGAGCFGLLGAWEIWGQGDLNVCLGEPLTILERGPIRGDAGSAARQPHGRRL